MDGKNIKVPSSLEDFSRKMEVVEEKLKKIAEHTKPKSSFLLTLSGHDSRLERTFEPEISVTPGCHYEIAFTSLETYYSIPNINLTNNTLRVARSGQPWITLTLDTGCYGLMDLNAEIGRLLEVEGMRKAVEFKPNYNTFKCVMTIRAGYAVNFTVRGSLRTVLGFEAKSYKSEMTKRFESEHTVQILTVNSILIHCYLVGASYLNGRRVPVIHSFFPLADPGDKIVERPVQYIYLPIASDVIRHMTVWLTDQDQNYLDLRGESLTIKFHLRSC